MRSGHAQTAAPSSFRNARYEISFRRDQHAGLGIAKHHPRARIIVRGKASALDGDFAAGDCGRGRNAFDGDTSRS